MPHIGCKYIGRRSPSSTVEMGSIGKNSTFSEHGHAAYQLNGITKLSLIVANILPADTPPDSRGQKAKIQLFQYNVMLHINCKGITNTATW